MAEEKEKDEKPLVERWLEDQQEWQKTMLRYMDSMASNEDFLVHLGNAMRGSLLAGKPYPGTAPSAGGSSTSQSAEAEPGDAPAAEDVRLDRVLFALHEIQGQLNDLHLTVDRLAARIDAVEPSGGSEPAPDQPAADTAESVTETTSRSTKDRAPRSRSSRSSETAAGSPRLRRSQPRSAMGRRGDSD